MLFNSLPFNSIAQNSTQTSLSRKYHIEFFVKMYHAKVPSKTLSKVRCRKRLFWNARLELLVQKNCPKHHHKFTFDKRQYVKFHGKTSIQNAAPNTVKKPDWRKGSIYMLVKKTSYIKACQNTVRNFCRWENRKHVKMLVKKVSYKKATQNTIRKVAT